MKQLCGLEASQGTVAEVLSSAASAKADDVDSNDELDPEDEERDNERKEARKKKNKRRKGTIPPKSLLNTCTAFKQGRLAWLLIWTVLMLSSQKVARAVMAMNTRWMFGWCSPPTFGLKMYADSPSSVGVPGRPLALQPFGPGCTEGEVIALGCD